MIISGNNLSNNLCLAYIHKFSTICSKLLEITVGISIYSKLIYEIDCGCSYKNAVINFIKYFT